MLHYINVNSKRFCGRNNNINTKPLILEYNTVEHLEFQFITDNNQIVELSNLSGLALAVGLKQNKPSYDLLALSRDYTIEDNVLKFNLNCYTVNWLREVNKNNTEAYVEISQESISAKQVLLRDYCLVWPRTLIDGLSPEEIQSNNYFTKEETQEAIDEAIAGIELSGYVTEQQFEDGLATKQNTITDENKLDYALISGAPTALSGISLNGIPSEVTDNIVNIPRTSQNDWGVVRVNPSVGIGADSGQIYTIKAEPSEIAARSNNFKPIVPSNLNTAVKAALTDSSHIELTDAEKETAMTVLGVDAVVSGYATESYVQGEVSGKQDKITNDNKLDYSLLSSTPTIPVVPTNVSDFTNDAGYQTAQDVQDAISGKQDLIDANSKLDYSLLSGTPAVPTKTSDLQNDSGFITDADLSGKQDVIDANNKLDYSLVSGAPTVPTSTSQLTNDSNFINQTTLETALSGKQDVIDDANMLDASYVTTDIEPWQGDGQFTVRAAINEVHAEALEALSGIDTVSGALSGKQDVIDSNNKLDYSLLSGTPSIPLSTSELVNDSDFATSGYVNNQVTTATSGKLDKTDYVAPYKLPYNAGGNGWLEEDIGTTLAWSDQDIIPNDRKIVVVAYSNNGDDHLVFPTLISYANENVIKTCEVWVKMAGNTTEAQGIVEIDVPSSYYIVDESNFPSNLKGEATNNEAYTYHVFVIRAVPRQSGTLCEVGYSHYINTNLSI